MAEASEGQSPSLVIVDATAYLFRSFHAIRDLRTRDGQPTNAVYGIAMTLAQLRDRRPDSAFACVMDAAGPTFRHEMYPDYKGTRKQIDPDLVRQIEPAKQLIAALGMSLYCVSGVEADDVIATLATQAVRTSRECTVATADKDLMYLAGKGCKILDPVRDKEFDAKSVTERFGVAPERMLDYLSLIGDSSDNVPGVPGVGPKTAVKWLAEHGDLDSIIANRDQFKGKVGESLRSSLDQLKLARELIRLREDIELDPSPDGLVPPQPDQEGLAKLCEDLRFNDNLRKRLGQARQSAAMAEIKPEVLLTEESFTAAARHCADVVNIGLHIETQGTDAPSASLVSFAVYANGKGYFVPIDHRGEAAANADKGAALAFLQKLLDKEDREIRLFDAKEAAHALANEAIKVNCREADIGILSFCADGTSSGHVATVTRRYLDYQVTERETLIGGRDKPKDFALLPVDTASAAACLWAKAALDLREVICSSMENPAMKLWRKVEVPAMAALFAMERNGICLDEKSLAALNAELDQRMATLRDKITDIVGEIINLNSPKQLGALLYDKLGLDAGRKTKLGALSTNEAELERLARQSDSEVPRLVLDYRHVAKLAGTYTSALPKSVNPATGRVHTRFIQAGANTGRLASKDPNLQNIPIRSAEGHRIRQCFVAPEGKVLLSADYSQIELRILAHLSGDKTLLESFAAGEDVHLRTAAELHDVAPDKVDADMRRFAKTINFGLIYGMGTFGLAARLGIPQAQAREIIDKYFARLPGVRDYLDSIKEQAKKTKSVTTMFGRTINIGAGEQTTAAASGSMRAAINAPMQGSAADIMKIAMAKVQERLEKSDPDTMMLLQVHDELILEAPEHKAEEIKQWLPEVMGSVARLKVPLTVDVGSGGNWDEAH